MEIDHAAALASGVTPGDTPGFPVTIDQPGAYLLTSHLSPPQSDFREPLVDIHASFVDLNLNGFTLYGSVFALTSIDATADADQIVVRNGFVKLSTIRIRGDQARIEGVTTSDSPAIFCGDRCTVVHSALESSYDEPGLRCGNLCSLIRTRIHGDEGAMVCGDNCRVDSSVLFSPETTPYVLDAGDHAQILHSTLENSLGSGVSCGDHCLIADSVISSYFLTVQAGANALLKGIVVDSRQEPIRIGDGSSLVQSSVRTETELVLRVTFGTARYSDTIFTVLDGSAPTFSGNAIDMGGNVCDGTAGCP